MRKLVGAKKKELRGVENALEKGVRRKQKKRKNAAPKRKRKEGNDGKIKIIK